MRSPVTNQLVPVGGCRSISVAGGRSFAPIKVISSTSTLSLSVSTKQNHSPHDLWPIPPLHSLSSSPPPPWLLVSSSYFNPNPNQELLNHYPYCFVSISDNKIFRPDKTQVPSQMRLPWDDEFFFPEDTEFHGTSSRGWVFVMHPRTQQMFLVNPLFPSDSIVPLPPVHHFDPTVVAGSVSKSATWSYTDNPNLFTEYISWREGHLYIYPMDHYAEENISFYPQFAMSSAPSDPTCTVLVQNLGVLGFWKPGHKSWTRLEVPNASYFGDAIVYSNASRCFYVLDKATKKANVDAWKWDSDSPQPQRTGHFEVSSPVAGANRCADCWNSRERDWDLRRKYLVESWSGDLLLVEMYSIDEEDNEDEYEDPPSLQFYVYKLNFEECKWEHVESLGGEAGYALFMGNDYGFCARVGNYYPELKPNCIYYSADDSETILLPKAAALPMVLVFDMKDATVHPYRFLSRNHPNYDLAPLNHPSIWLLPNLNC